MKFIRKILAAFLCLSLAACSPKSYTITNSVDIQYSDAQMNQYKWIGQPIADFRKITLKEALRFFDAGGSGILFFGYVGCQWCERAVPQLNQAANDTKTTIWYVDAKAPVDEKDYKQMMEDLEDVLQKDDDGNPNFFVPLVVGIKNGKVTGSHTSLVSSFKPEGNNQLSESQARQLRNEYLKIIEKTAD